MSLSSNSWIFASRVFCDFLTGELFTWLLLVPRSHGSRTLDSLLDPLLSHYPLPDRLVVLVGFLLMGRANDEIAAPAPVLARCLLAKCFTGMPIRSWAEAIRAFFSAGVCFKVALCEAVSPAGPVSPRWRFAKAFTIELGVASFVFPLLAAAANRCFPNAESRGTPGIIYLRIELWTAWWSWFFFCRELFEDLFLLGSWDPGTVVAHRQVDLLTGRANRKVDLLLSTTVLVRVHQQVDYGLTQRVARVAGSRPQHVALSRGDAGQRPGQHHHARRGHDADNRRKASRRRGWLATPPSKGRGRLPDGVL